MGVASVNQTVALLSRLLNTRKSTVPVVETAFRKPPCLPAAVARPLPRATPEAMGISSAHVARFIEELRRETTLNMHSLLILRRGTVITEAVFGAQDLRVPKMTFSACKSITALAVGMLIDEGLLRLDTRVAELFPNKTTPVTRLRYKELTVEHLLTMTSGVTFNEAESMTQSDWIRGFFNSSASARPGKVFAYNSLNTYLLAAVVVRVAGESMTEYLRPRLFEPLGIEQVFWETCPLGIEKGGWGLYIRPEDLAKIGQLVLEQGVWNGRQIVSSEWLQQAITAKCKAPESYGDFDYGYQIWTGRHSRSFLFNGMMGQNVLGFPDTGVLLVTNAGNDEMFQQSRYFSLAQEYFGGDFPDHLSEDEQHSQALIRTIASCRPADPLLPKRLWWHRFFPVPEQPSLPVQAYEWNGLSFRTISPNAASVGLLPMVLQATQNNYTGGLLNLRCEVAGDHFTVTYGEADRLHRLPVGFDKPQITELSFQGEPYRVAVRGRFAKNEDDQSVLILTVDFLETPCTRTIKLVRGGNGLRLIQTERPGEPFLMSLLDEIKQRLDARPLIGAAVDKLDEDYVRYKIQAMFSPTVELEEA